RPCATAGCSAVSASSDLEQNIGYRFADRDLLDKALTHASVQGRDQNERLEFLGDRVLGLVIAALLYRNFPDEPEGFLAKRLTGLVQQKALADVADDIRLSDYIRLSGGECSAGGERKNAILADEVEALIGAVYLDGGFAAAE